MTSKGYTNIVVDWATRDRLKEHGKAGDSYLDVIKALLDAKESARNSSSSSKSLSSPMAVMGAAVSKK